MYSFAPVEWAKMPYLLSLDLIANYNLTESV